MNETPKLHTPRSLPGKIAYKLSDIMQLNVARDLKLVMKNLKLSTSELKALQRRKLSRVVRHAYDTVPYYRRLFDKTGVTPDKIKDPSDLSMLPITKKTDIQKYSKEMISSKAGKLSEIHTSGSTGKPLVLYNSRPHSKRRVAEGRRVLKIHGYKATDKILLLSYYNFGTDFINKLGLYRQMQLDWHMTIDEQIDGIKDYDPDVIEGYPSRIRLIARHPRVKEIRKPKFILTNSEMLYPDVRKEIETGFGCPLYDSYDSEEFGQIAWECNKGNMHINADSLIVEIVDKKGKPARKGAVVVTDLDNLAMPLIRYEIGDIAETKKGKCMCGIHFPLISSLHGRESDYIIDADNKKISSTSLVFPAQIGGIKEFQFIQKKKGALEMLIVKDNNYSDKLKNEIIKLAEKITGIKDIKIKEVKSIPRSKRAKYRRFIPLSSHVRDRAR